jgi:hypothetical protein
MSHLLSIILKFPLTFRSHLLETESLMRFEDYLLRKQFLTKHEYLELIWHGAKGVNGTTNIDTDLLLPKLPDEGSIAEFMRIPFGDSLQRHFKNTLDNVLGKSQCQTLDELVEKWQKFHSVGLEPISEYSLTTTFGKKLYENVAEKKACARFVAQSDAFGVAQIVHDGDHVIVPEGSSAFYVGLAIAAIRRNITLITSNGPLIRELSENTFLTKRLKNVFVVGGEMDLDSDGRVASRGFLGINSQAEFARVSKDSPGATVLVCSVNGLLPHEGPFAPSIPTPKSCKTRLSLLDECARNGIRQIAFVCDWTKMLFSKKSSYGEPIFAIRQTWERFLRDYVNNITFVIAPPAAISASAEFAKLSPRNRPFQGLSDDMNSSSYREYLKCVKELDESVTELTFDKRIFEIFASESVRA